jgi:hypothetical protein
VTRREGPGGSVPASREEIRTLVAMALCVVLGLFVKRLVSPATGLVADLVRMPGGGISGGIGMGLLTLGASLARRRWAGTLMGLLQGALALALGLSGYQGFFALATFSVPGLAIDLVRWAWGDARGRAGFFLVATSAASASSALASSLLVFHFTGTALLLWVALAASAGLVGGGLAGLLHGRLRRLGFEGRNGDGT